MGLFEARTDTEGHSSAGASPAVRLNIAFGLERLGFLGVRAPIAALIGLVALVALAVAGVSRIDVDDSLSELFRSETPQFKTFETESHKFPSQRI